MRRFVTAAFALWLLLPRGGSWADAPVPIRAPAAEGSAPLGDNGTEDGAAAGDGTTDGPGAVDDLASRPKVVAVAVHLPPGSDPTGFPEQIAVPRNQPLSMRAVRRSIERLYATGRVADVVVRRVDVEGGVRIIFEITPKRRIVEIDVDGEKVLKEEEILAASRLSPGEEHYPELLVQARQRVQSLYHRRGYRSAQIAVDRQALPEGTSILITVQEGAPTRVDAVTVGGSPGLPISRVVDAVGLPPGSVLDLDALEAGVERLKALYRERRHYRARVGEPSLMPGARGGTTIAIPVAAGPRYDFHFHGNRSFPEKLLLGILAYDGTETLDRSVMSRMARRVATFYRYRGFHDVQVRPREVHTPSESEAVVAFDIDEGSPLYVRSVRFEGNEALSDDTLARILADQVASMEPQPSAEVSPLPDPLQTQGRTQGGPRATTPDPEPQTVFVADAWREASRAMRAAYREKGYLAAEVSVPEVEIDVGARRADATFRIKEGPHTTVREVKYLGLPIGFEPGGAAHLKIGEPFRYSAVDETIRSLSRSLGRSGYLFSRVEGDSQISATGRAAHVVFRVDKGPQVKVGRVIVRGLTRADESLVRANLLVREGAVLDPEAMFESQRNLVLLGIFRNVGVRLIDPEISDEVKDVVVDVKERPRISGDFSLGYSLAEGPRAGAEFAYPNFGGYGTSFTGRVKVNHVGASALPISGAGPEPDEVDGLDGINGRVNFALVQSRIFALLPLRLGLRADVIGERIHRSSFNFQRVAGVLGADWEANEWLTVTLQYEAEVDQVRLSSTVSRFTRVGSASLERYRFQSGNFSLHTLRPTVTLDFRDDFARPTRGVLFSGTADMTQDLGSALLLLGANTAEEFPIYSLKLAGTLTGYIPLAQRVVLALSARGGKFFHLHEDSRSIPPKRFFMGGAGSMRGFNEDGLVAEDRRVQLKRDLTDCRRLVYSEGCTPEADHLAEGKEVPSEGGEIFTLLKSELRFPAFGPFDLGVFLEMGNLWLDQRLYDPLKLRYVAGAGVRYGTPIGPIAVDVGVNLFPDLQINEPRANLHLSIGLF